MQAMDDAQRKKEEEEERRDSEEKRKEEDKKRREDDKRRAEMEEKELGEKKRLKEQVINIYIYIYMYSRSRTHAQYALLCEKKVPLHMLTHIHTGGCPQEGGEEEEGQGRREFRRGSQWQAAG